MKQPKLGRAIKTLLQSVGTGPSDTDEVGHTITKQKRENKLLVTLEQLSHRNSYKQTKTEHSPPSSYNQ